ncbi:ATP-binding protein [Nocardioides speluncae]|uniref:ATP-binding protein n=1 Tax=Nocardioides speluncae TaxID=2670337 RepID=UPI000D68D1E7|nr:AAA family ATPase [Nocardioides speluncae]
MKPETPPDGAVPRLTVSLLGGFGVARADRGEMTKHWRRESARTIIKLLALAPRHSLHREELMATCWPEAAAASAVGSLRVAVHAARRALEPELAPRAPSSYLHTDRDLILLDPGVDVDLDQAREQAEHALESADAGALAAAAEALAPELLPEDRYADWAMHPRHELARLRRSVALALAESVEPGQQVSQLIARLERLVSDDESDEELTRALMRLFVAAGQRASAAARYQRLRTVLQQELGVAPTAATESLAQSLGGAVPVPGREPEAAPVAVPAAIRRAVTPSLRGRRRALADLLDGMDAEPLTILSGESGVGKTRLAAEAVRQLTGRGVQVLWGAAYEAEGPLPYGPFVDAIDGWFADREPAEREAAGLEHPDLTGLVPGFGGPRVGSAVGKEDPARLFQAIGSLLDEISGGRPLVVVLDDFQFADLGSLRLLHYLLRTRPDGPVRYLTTIREDASTDDNGERVGTLTALTRQGLSRRIELMRLSRADTDRLVRDVVHASGQSTIVTASMLETVHRQSRGNPLLATEIARVVADGRTGEEGPLPDMVRELVGARLARMDEGTRSLLAVLAVAGGAVALTEVEDVTATDPRVITEQVDRLLADRLIDESEVVLSGRQVPGYRVRHPVIGTAVYDQLSLTRRRHLHGLLAAAARRHRPDAVDALAHHLDRAGDPEAVGWLRRAAERAVALYADDSADRHYSALVARLIAGDAPVEETTEARLGWAAVLTRRAHYPEADALLRAVLATPSLTGDHHAGALAMLGEVLGRSGRGEEGIELLTEDPTTPERVPPRVAFDLHLALANLLFVAGRYDEALAAADAAVTAAAAVGGDQERRSRGRAEHTRAACLLFTGRHREARAAAETALAAAEEFDDPGQQAKALSTLGELASMHGHLPEALAISRRTHALAERAGDPAVLAFERADLAIIQLRLGDEDLARRTARSALSTARPYGLTWCLPYVLLSLGEVELRTRPGEDPAEASRWLDQAMAAAGTLGNAQVEEMAAGLLAETDLARGRTDAALARLRGAGRGPGVATVRSSALLASGRVEAALVAAKEALATAQAHSDQPATLEARRVLAAALAAAGDGAEAREQLATARSAARRMGHRLAEQRLDAAERHLTA